MQSVFGGAGGLCKTENQLYLALSYSLVSFQKKQTSFLQNFSHIRGKEKNIGNKISRTSIFKGTIMFVRRRDTA